MATHPDDPRRPDEHDPAHTPAPNPEAGGTPEGSEQILRGTPETGPDSDSNVELGLAAGSADILSDSDLFPVGEGDSGVGQAQQAGEISGGDGGSRPAADSGARDIFSGEPTGRFPRPDTNLGTAAQPPETPAAEDPGKVDLGAEVPGPREFPGVESSIIDLGAVDFVPEVNASGITSGVEIVEETSGIELSSSEYEDVANASDSGLGFVDEPSRSGIELGRPKDLPPDPAESGASAMESVIQFGRPPAEGDEPKRPAPPPMESVIEFGPGSGARPPKTPPASPMSSAIEFGPPGSPASSAVEFGRQSTPPPESSAVEFGRPATPPESSAIEFGRPATPESSAIEFGSPPPPVPVFPSVPGGSAVSSAIDYGGVEQVQPVEDSSSAVELEEVESGELDAEEPPARAGGRPPTQPAGTAGRPPTKPAMTGGRPPTQPAVPGGRPETQPAMPEDLEAQIHAGDEERGPSDSEVDLGVHTSSEEFEMFNEPGSVPPVKVSGPDATEETAAAGSGLYVKADSGRLEPTDATINLDDDDELLPEEAPAAEQEPAEGEAGEEAPEAPPAGKKPGKAAKPAKAPKPARERKPLLTPARVPWIAGGGIGAVAGAAAVFALQLLGIGGGSAPKPAPPATPPQVVQPAPAPAPAVAAGPAVTKFDFLRNGDLDKAAQAGIEQVQETDPQQLAARGEYRWLAYLQKQHQSKAALNADDPAVKQAATDLQAAADKGNADAAFWLGHLQESTNAADKAKATWTKGATDAKDPLQRRRFEAALRRLELREPARPSGAARAPAAAEALLLALVALQAGAPAAAPAPVPAAPAAADADEAGFDFWDAARLAREQKFPEALQVLEKARALHDQRRFSRLRKAQNPLSDPTEEVFLRCADELKAYWQLEQKIRSGGYGSVDEVIARAKEAAPAKALADKLVAEKVIGRPEDLAAGVDTLAKGLKAAERQVAALQEEQKAAQAEAKAAKDQAAAEAAKVKEAEEKVTTGEAKLKAAEARERELAAAKAAGDAELKQVADELAKAKLLPADAGKDALLQGVRSAAKLATAADSQGLARGLQAEVARLSDQLGQRWQPREMLTYWFPILRYGGRADLAAKAARDAERVEADPAATPADKARAEAVLGLALRNQGKLAEAKSALEKARSGLAPADGEWRQQVDAALKAVADPAAYYAARAEELRSKGKPAEAVAELEKAEGQFPAGKDRLLAQRGLLRLEAARAKAPGKLAPNDPDLQAARRDAEAASRGGDAFALFAAGRVAEAAGDFQSAVANYRKAVAAHPAHDADGSRYRLALARALIRAAAASSPPAEAPRPAEPSGEAANRSAPTPAALFLALATFLQEPLPADQSEAIQLADEVLASKDSTLEERAQALAIKGLYTQALLTYVDALRPVLRPEQVETLRELIQSHPAMRRPESQTVASPEAAERHFATGLRLLYSGQPAAAEKELLAAVQADGQDARYFYFLGLARMNQGKRDAYDDFARGAKLEQQGLPPTDSVNIALERVQGSARRAVDNARGLAR